MLESPISPVVPPGHDLPSPACSIKEALKLLSPPSSPFLPSFRRCGSPSLRDGVPAVDSSRPAPRPRRLIQVNDPGLGRVPAVNPRRTQPDSRPRAPPPRPVEDPGSASLPLPAPSSRKSAPRPQPSIRVHDAGSRRVRDIKLPRPAPRPRPSIRADDPSRVRAVTSNRPAARAPGVLGSCKAPPAANKELNEAANKELEEAENEIRRLNELGLGDDISYEEYSAYIKQLPVKPDVDSSTKLDAIQLKELNTRHELYRVKYRPMSKTLSQQVPEDKLCYDKFKEDYPPGRLEAEGFSKSYEDGKLDWSFHPDYCKLAGLEDYQRLIPRNYGGFEYVRWDEYGKYFHGYEIEQEYIKYCEDLSKKLKWMEAYVPNKSPSLKWGRILTRGTYQAIKIATEFSKITGRLAFSGFCEWLESMSFDVCHYNEFDGVYYEIWQRCTNETKFRDVLDEVYELNRFPLRQDRMRCALENDTFCSDFEDEFLACTTCLKEFTEDKAQVTEEKARELIGEALRKEKPKFYEDYCRRKIDIARAIGLISS